MWVWVSCWVRWDVSWSVMVMWGVLVRVRVGMVCFPKKWLKGCSVGWVGGGCQCGV